MQVYGRVMTAIVVVGVLGGTAAARVTASRQQKTVENEWRDAQAKALTPKKDGGYTEDGTVYEKFVQSHPTFAPARLALAKYQEDLANAIKDRSPKSNQTRTRHLESAASHYRLAAEHATDRTDAVTALVGLAITLDADNLNRPAEALTAVRGGIAKYGPEPGLVLRLLRLVLPTASAAVTGQALRSARTELGSANPEALHAYGMHLWELAARSPVQLPRETMQTLLAEAMSAFDAALKLKPDFMEALTYKSIVLRLQAKQVELDPVKAKALVAEADRLQEQAKRLMNRKRP